MQITRLRAPEAARFLRISPSTLAKLRMRGDGPTFTRIGATVLYDVEYLRDYLNARRVRSTAEAKARREGASK